jgi:hypothetical protein
VEVLDRRAGMPTAEDVIVNALHWWQREHRRNDFERLPDHFIELGRAHCHPPRVLMSIT